MKTNTLPILVSIIIVLGSLGFFLGQSISSAQVACPFYEGWNLVGGKSGSPADSPECVKAIYGWDGENQNWLSWFRSGPDFVNDLEDMDLVEGYWFYIER